MGKTAAAPVLTPAKVKIPGLGKATFCQLGKMDTRHQAVRYIWHHILPRVCGGHTVKDNLAQLCDNCHYAVHQIMWKLAHGQDVSGYPRRQVKLARQGYDAAKAAGTDAKLPKEAA